MIMDLISLATDAAALARCALAALKAEKGLLLEARKLMRTCQLYEDCLKTLISTIQDHARMSAITGTVKNDFDKGLQNICNHLKDDKDMLENIAKQVQGVDRSYSKSRGISGKVKNLFISATTGRVAEIAQLSNQLNVRMQQITTFMVQGIWKNNFAGDEALFVSLDDIDASLFWRGFFETKRIVALQMFLEAYQSYLSRTFLFRKFTEEQLAILLRCSLLGEAAAGQGNNSAAEVTLEMFCKWIKRFGPFSDTLHKVAAVSHPLQGSHVAWFQPRMNRTAAERYLDSIAANSSKVQPYQLFVCRYSSDEKYHFVFTTKLPGKSSFDHFPVMNTGSGYCVIGDESDVFPTLLDCAQHSVVEKCFGKSLNLNLQLPKDGIDEWYAIFDELRAELKEDHYKDAAALDAEVSQITASTGGAGSSNSAPKSSSSFGSMFSKLRSGSSDTSTTTTAAAVATPMDSSSAVLSGLSVTASERAKIGKYMVLQGLDLLQGTVEAEHIHTIRQLLQLN